MYTAEHRFRLDSHSAMSHTRAEDLSKLIELIRDIRIALLTTVDREGGVSLGYADPANNAYVALSGSGRLLRDVQRAKLLWSAEQRAYYPDGPQDGRLGGRTG
jgi:hypothetical protein